MTLVISIGFLTIPSAVDKPASEVLSLMQMSRLHLFAILSRLGYSITPGNGRLLTVVGTSFWQPSPRPTWSASFILLL
jgi:hypothetical protein